MYVTILVNMWCGWKKTRITKPGVKINYLPITLVLGGYFPIQKVTFVVGKGFLLHLHKDCTKIA